MAGSQTIWLFKEPLPVFSELVVGRLDHYSDLFTHSPIAVLVKCTSYALTLALPGHVTFCGQQNEAEMTVAYF